MADDRPWASAAGIGQPAYDAAAVERFFAEAYGERARLLSEVAIARRRVADARATLDGTNDAARAYVASVVAAQGALRRERQANERAIAALTADAAARAEQLLREAHARALAQPPRYRAGTHEAHEPTDRWMGGGRYEASLGNYPSNGNGGHSAH